MKNIYKDYLYDYNAKGGFSVPAVGMASMCTLYIANKVRDNYVTGDIATNMNWIMELILFIIPLLIGIVSSIYHGISLPRMMQLVPISINDKRKYLYEKYLIKVSVNAVIGAASGILLIVIYNHDIVTSTILMIEYLFYAMTVSMHNHISKSTEFGKNELLTLILTLFIGGVVGGLSDGERISGLAQVSFIAISMCMQCILMYFHLRHIREKIENEVNHAI